MPRDSGRESLEERAECARKVIAPCAVMHMRPPAPRARRAPPHPPHCLARSAADKGEATEPKGDRNHFNANPSFIFTFC